MIREKTIVLGGKHYLGGKILDAVKVYVHMVTTLHMAFARSWDTIKPQASIKSNE